MPVAARETVAADAPHILVVDDDTRLRELLRRYLVGEGFRVTTAADAAEARQRLAGIAFDLIVLDVMMPGESGLELTEALRRTHDIPIVLLTARGAPEDRIAGFEHGADDYLAKPFEPRELLLRIRTILRRTAPTPGTAEGKVTLGEAVFDPERGTLTRGQETVRLTGGEAALLAALARRPGEVLTREEIAAALGQEDAGERAIDVQVTRLRRKIEPDPREPTFLQTVRGRGYVLRPR
ncbi:response regulator transcription factor [Elioraea sp. Yellowstone]|jgi:two-component system phosphate regulon response regulator OmpR|uniref:response regulator n=1 Tax=Elioraea sp. Yellowstone TaxID=2592070 RepID=UPI00114D9A91|nr:response regulator transcription factor [Elioraea sp. Yellowstone]TQF78116.1 response regulator transcription factor [Elioraea sp. Yellowstone]